MPPSIAPTASRTAPAVEAALTRTRQELREADEEAHRLQARADELRDSFGLPRLNSDAEALREVDAAYEEAARVQRRATELRGEVQGLTRQAVAGHETFRGMPAVTVPDEDLLAFRDSILAGRADVLRTRTVSSTEAPQAGQVSYLETFEALRESFRVASLIPATRVDTPTVEFYTTTTTSTAGTVAEGGTKPESTPVFTANQTDVTKLAHIAQATTEVASDWSEFQRVISVEMLAALADLESDQLLNGDGVGANLTGILNTTGIGSVARNLGGTGTADDEARLDAIYRAITNIRVNGKGRGEPDAVLMHPNDWQDVVLSKDSNASYYSGSPFQGPPGTIFGIPVHPTTHLTEGTALVGDFRRGARIYLREPASFAVNAGGGLTEWQSNVILLRAEERLALAVPYAELFCEITSL